MLFEWLLNFRYIVGCLIFSTGGFVSGDLPVDLPVDLPADLLVDLPVETSRKVTSFEHCGDSTG